MPEITEAEMREISDFIRESRDYQATSKSQLAGIEQHLAKLNGSVARNVEKIGQGELAIARMQTVLEHEREDRLDERNERRRADEKLESKNDKQSDKFVEYVKSQGIPIVAVVLILLQLWLNR